MARSSTKTKSVSIYDALTEATSIKQGARETVEAFKERLLHAVDELSDAVFNKLPEDAQEFYKKALRAWNGKDGHARDTLIPIPGFDDKPEEAAEEAAPKKKGAGRSRMSSRDEDPEEPDDEDEDEDEEDEGDGEDEGDEEEEEEEEQPRGRGRAREPAAAKGKGKPAAKATAKPAAAKGKANGKAPAPAAKASSEKGKGAAPAKAAAKAPASKERKPRALNKEGAVWNIKEELITDPTLTVAEIQKRLAKRKIEATTNTITGIRSDFLNSLNVLKDHGLIDTKLAKSLPG